MTSFDPYLAWFGILPQDRPIDHYRFLGLDLFEGSKSNIEDAVSQRAALLPAMSMGDHVADAQRVMNEVAKARVF